MQWKMAAPCKKFGFEEDSNGDVWVSDGHGGRVKETYNDFYYSLAETRNEDDIKKQFNIPKPLFMQLVVQASKVTPIICFSDPNDTISFYQLLCKIKFGSIELDQVVIAMTHKDAKHRLLSYIPAGKVNQLVNGKKIRMGFIVGSRLVDKGEKVENRTTVPIIEEDFPIDPAHLVFPELGHGHSWRGKETELTGEDQLSSNYDFECR